MLSSECQILQSLNRVNALARVWAVQIDHIGGGEWVVDARFAALLHSGHGRSTKRIGGI